jgi:hypothetical protein
MVLEKRSARPTAVEAPPEAGVWRSIAETVIAAR